MQLTTQPYFFAYDFVTASESEWRDLPASVSYPNNVTYVTIPWTQLTDPPGEIGYPQLSVNGWTFLYGPCVATITAQIQIYEGQPLASGHALLYETDSQSGTMLKQHPNWEWEVLSKETHSSHLMGSWHVKLAEGRRLRLAADYWHATSPARIFKANVEGLYWRY